MKLLGLKSIIRIKKYKSYKGEQGKIAPNILERNFKAAAPNQKWATDITEFNVSGKKLYLSPIIDLFNQEIISYELSERPVFNQVVTMLKKAFKKVPDNSNLTFRPRLAVSNETVSIFIKTKRHYTKYVTQRKLSR